ncbi:excalibur calcium-binding domain-containing protein [Embleya sp. NBC_00896]|uniref:excalibur calcium-binding domain-containing protein n=1 Tax=Embleya sp. NBC_00896 TaxID=2975961 RepID=UPI002F91769F|nr:excalibur calcium-binding domain-containing protein [Embleya sp. NBC_00896]
MRRTLSLSAAGLAALTAVAVGGCGSSEDASDPRPSTVTVTAPPSPSATPTPSESPAPTPTATVTVTNPAPPRSSPVADAASVVRAYFDAVNRHDHRRAWDLGGHRFAASYEQFVAGFATTAHDRVDIVSVRGETVTITLDAIQTDATHRYFVGTYTVRDGAIVRADLDQVGGTSGPTDPTAPTHSTGPTGRTFANCDEARAAGVAPLHSGEPGYSAELDADGDGVACEPYTPHLPF